jgi:hypothetical protein
VERPQVAIELSEALARDIATGGVFVPGCSVTLNEECALVVHGPREEIELVARVVYVDPRTGAGLELVGFSAALREHLANLFDAWLAESSLAVDIEPPATVADDVPSTRRSARSDVIDAPATEADGEARPDNLDEAEAWTDEPPLATDGEARPDDLALEAEAATASEIDVEASLTDEEKADETKRARALSLHERLRGLTMSQQIKVAQRGDQQERIMLERYYNKNVWEPLLRNPKLTSPEVARIARMGTLPRVLLEVIVNNGAWLQVPEVRRALLSNPRLGTDQILRVLRMLPKHELKLASMQTAYPYAVRDAAKRVIKDQGGDK